VSIRKELSPARSALEKSKTVWGVVSHYCRTDAQLRIVSVTHHLELWNLTVPGMNCGISS